MLEEEISTPHHSSSRSEQEAAVYASQWINVHDASVDAAFSQPGSLNSLYQSFGLLFSKHLFRSTGRDVAAGELVAVNDYYGDDSWQVWKVANPMLVAQSNILVPYLSRKPIDCRYAGFVVRGRHAA
jgi:hypothetical protein